MDHEIGPGENDAPADPNGHRRGTTGSEDDPAYNERVEDLSASTYLKLLSFLLHRASEYVALFRNVRD